MIVAQAALACAAALALPTPALSTPAQATDDDAIAVKVGAMLQLRYGYAAAVDDPSTGVDEGAADARNGFALRRGRIRLQVSRKRLKIKGGFDFAKGKPRLLSLYLRAKLPGGISVRVGQTKRLLTQSYLDSSTTQRLIERAALGDQVGSNRDVGVRFQRRFLGKKLIVQAAVLNGNGANTVANDTGRLLFEGRVDAHLVRHLDLADPTIGRKLALVVGGAFGRGALRAARFKSGSQLTKIDISQAWSAHAAVRWQRIELRAELLWHDLTAEDARVDTRTALGVDPTRAGGWLAQIAWQPPVARRHLEVSARFNRWEAKRGDLDTRTDELEGCVGWRFLADQIKAQVAWRQKTIHRGGGVHFSEQRVQMQLQADM